MPRKKNDTIPFVELSQPQYNDSNSFVWTALAFRPAELRQIEEWLKQTTFLPKKARIKSMRRITGNIHGDEGRTDIFFVTAAPVAFSPAARLLVNGLKWTSDFISNQGKDYGAMPSATSLSDDDDESVLGDSAGGDYFFDPNGDYVRRGFYF